MFLNQCLYLLQARSRIKVVKWMDINLLRKRSVCQGSDTDNSGFLDSLNNCVLRDIFMIHLLIFREEEGGSYRFLKILSQNEYNCFAVWRIWSHLFSCLFGLPYFKVVIKKGLFSPTRYDKRPNYNFGT